MYLNHNHVDFSYRQEVGQFRKSCRAGALKRTKTEFPGRKQDWVKDYRREAKWSYIRSMWQSRKDTESGIGTPVRDRIRI